MLDWLPGVVGTPQVTDEQRARLIHARMVVGAPVSASDSLWMYSRGKSSNVWPASPYSYFNPRTSTWSPTPTATPTPDNGAARAAKRSEGLARWKGAAEARVSSVGFWAAYGHPEYKGVYQEPSVPAGWTVESVTKTPAGEPEIQLRLTNLEAALASGQTFPPEVMETYLAKKRYFKDVAVSKTEWAELGYPQYGGRYTSPEVPSGFKIHSVTESDLGLSIEFEPIVSMQAKYGPAIANMRTQQSQMFAEKYSPAIANMLTQRFNEKYGSAIANMENVKSQLFLEKYSPAMMSRASQLSQLFVEKYTPAMANRASQIFAEKYSPAIAKMVSQKTVNVSADEYFSQIYTHDINVPISPGSKDLPLIAPTLPKELKLAYGEWLSSKRFWGEKGTGHYFPEYVGKYAPMSAEAVAAMGEGWQIEKITESPEGLAIAWKQPPKSITQQISEFKVPALNLGLRSREEMTMFDLLEGRKIGEQRYAKPLAPLELVFAPVEQAVLGTAHLVARVLGKDNPYFAAQPPISPFSAGVSFAVTGGSTSGFEELGKLEPYEVMFRGLGDILALKPAAELAVNLAKQGASKLATRIEVWRYGAEGSEKWMESIGKGTIVNPETGMTTYTGFAAKQASKLSPGTVSLPFGTEKSLANILSSTTEEEAAGALDFSWGAGAVPRTSMLSISKLVNPAYVRPNLPIYQMIGGSLVNVSEMVTSWTESEKFKFSTPETTIKQTSIQSDFKQLGFKDVITPKETPFNVQGFKDLPTGYSGSVSQQLYMKATSVVSEVKSMFSDTGSAARMEMAFAKPSMSFMETSVQGISAGVSLPAARLAVLKAASLTSTTLQEALASANLVTFGNLVERVSSGLPVKPEIAFFFTAGMDLRKSYAIPTLSTKDIKYPHTNIFLPLQELGTSVTRAVISHEIGHATLFSLSLTREGKSIIQAKYGPPPAEWVHVPMSTVMYEKASSELAKKAGLSLQGKWLLGKAFRISKKTIKKEMKAGGLGLFPNAPVIMKDILASKTEGAISPSTLMKPTLKSNLWLTTEQGEPYYNPNKWLSSHGPVYPRRKPSEAISPIPNFTIEETVRTKLSTEFAFPTSVGAFPVIPDITMSRQRQRLETEHSDIEEYLGVSAKLFQSQQAQSSYKTSVLQVSQLARLKPMEGVTHMPKIADFLGGMEREDLMPLSMVGLASIPIQAQVPGLKQISLTSQAAMMKSGFASQFGYTPTDIFGTMPSAPFMFPRLGGSSGGGASGRGFGKWFKITRPILEPKQVWKQFWGMPKLSVRRIGAKGKRSKVSVTRVGSRKKRSKRKK